MGTLWALFLPNRWTTEGHVNETPTRDPKDPPTSFTSDSDEKIIVYINL